MKTVYCPHCSKPLQAKTYIARRGISTELTAGIAGLLFAVGLAAGIVGGMHSRAQPIRTPVLGKPFSRGALEIRPVLATWTDDPKAVSLFCFVRNISEGQVFSPTTDVVVTDNFGNPLNAPADWPWPDSLGDDSSPLNPNEARVLTFLAGAINPKATEYRFAFTQTCGIGKTCTWKFTVPTDKIEGHPDTLP